LIVFMMQTGVTSMMRLWSGTKLVRATLELSEIQTLSD